jgi:hypothetical protein
MAQTITATTNVRDAAAAFALYAAQDNNYIDFNGMQDEQVLILVKNTNDAVAVETATITISPAPDVEGPWMRDLGTATITIADANSMKTLGPLSSARFKGTNGLVTLNVSVTQSGTASSVEIGVVKLPK